jgi:hypothetical protein
MGLMLGQMMLYMGDRPILAYFHEVHMATTRSMPIEKTHAFLQIKKLNIHSNEWGDLQMRPKKSG